MEEQLKQHLQDFVETLKAGGEFALEQLPLFVKEYLTWGFWESIVLAIIFVIVSTLLGLLSKHIHNKLKENDPYVDAGYWLGIATSALLSALMVGLAIGRILIAIQITVAPRVYLIENLTNLL